MLEIKQGQSGFKVEFVDSGHHVLKSTSGIDSNIKLLRDALKQISFEQKFHNFEVVKIFDLNYSGQKSFYKMVNHGIDLCSKEIDLEYLEKSIEVSLLNRCDSAKFGLNNILNDEVTRIKNFVREIHGIEEANKIKISEYLCNKDHYISGLCHGDFGLRNMYFDNQRLYISDFTHSFIESPLMDVITLKLSIDNKSVSLDKKKMVDSIYNNYKDYSQQMSAILKVKELAWFYRC